MPSAFRSLVPGEVSEEHLNVIMAFLGLKSEPLKGALTAHFVHAKSQADAVEEFESVQSLVSRKCRDVQEMHQKLFEASAHYQYYRLVEQKTRDELKAELREELLERVRASLQ